MQNPRREREVRGAADRKEFRQTLDDAKDECLKDGHVKGGEVRGYERTARARS